jgi:predicted DNA-binding protein with PD1-like motif
MAMKLRLIASAVLLAAVAPLLAADAVPAVSTETSRFNRAVVIRLKYQTDILAGLQEAVAREKIRNGIFLSAFGSVTSYHVHVVKTTSMPPENVYVKGAGAYDILTVTGAVIEGRVHAHIILASENKTTGGHLESGTSVLTFAVITLGVLDDKADIKRVDDMNWR